MFLRQTSSPEIVATDESPPPPPPRTAVPKHYNSATLGRKPPPSSHQFVSNLVRSNSQEELGSCSTVSTTRPPVRNNVSKINGKLSSSTEDIGLKRSPISPSKLSVTSSSDSLSSTASVNTVKSASPQEENPPSLPPRHSPVKTHKPCVPPLASPETAADLSPLKISSSSPYKNGNISPVRSSVNGLHSPTSTCKPLLPSRLSKASPNSSPIKQTSSHSSKSSPCRVLPQAPPTPRLSGSLPSKGGIPTPPRDNIMGLNS